MRTGAVGESDIDGMDNDIAAALIAAFMLNQARAPISGGRLTKPDRRTVELPGQVIGDCLKICPPLSLGGVA